MKIRNFIILIALVLAIFLATPVYAGNGGIDLMKESIGPRPLALGSAFSAVGESVYSPGWNPAGIIGISRMTIASSYANLYEDISQYGVLGAWPAMEGVAGISVILEKTGEAPLTTLGDDGRPDILGTFADTKLLLALTYARPILMKDLSAGINLKYHNETLASGSASGIGFDLGVLYQPEPWSLGLTLRNPLNTQLKWSTGNTDFMNREIVLGAAYTGRIGEQNFLLTADFNYGSSKKFCAGAEYWLTEMFPIRAGFNKQGQLTLGTGVKFQNFEFDVAYFNHQDLGPTYQAAFSWK